MSVEDTENPHSYLPGHDIVLQLSVSMEDPNDLYQHLPGQHPVLQLAVSVEDPEQPRPPQ